MYLYIYVIYRMNRSIGKILIAMFRKNPYMYVYFCIDIRFVMKVYKFIKTAKSEQLLKFKM